MSLTISNIRFFFSSVEWKIANLQIDLIDVFLCFVKNFRNEFLKKTENLELIP
jgi:hypothetical protein